MESRDFLYAKATHLASGSKEAFALEVFCGGVGSFMQGGDVSEAD